MNVEIVLKNAFEIKELKPNSFQIKTGAILPNGKNLYCFLDKTPNGWILNDKKYVLQYMNNMYFLGSKDVKNCIKGVLTAHKFKMIQNVIVTEVKDESVLLQKVFDFVMCVSQLINMYVFFDSPTN